MSDLARKWLKLALNMQIWEFWDHNRAKMYWELYLKKSQNAPFSANLTHIEPKSDIPVLKMYKNVHYNEVRLGKSGKSPKCSSLACLLPAWQRWCCSDELTRDAGHTGIYTWIIHSQIMDFHRAVWQPCHLSVRGDLLVVETSAHWQGGQCDIK